MKKVLSACEMQECDRFTINNMGIPSMVLMERAALSTVEEIISVTAKDKKILVVAGTGNNGGDGIAVARLLKLQGFKVKVLVQGNIEKASVDFINQYNIAKNYEVPIEKVNLDNEDDFENADLIVDSIFGVGLNRDVKGDYGKAIELINKAGKNGKTVVAVDIPSGINADSGQVMNVAVKADLTVTFAYYKRGHMLWPGRLYSGNVIVKDIGINDYSLKKFSNIYTDMTSHEMRIIRKRRYSNKADYGKVCIIGGDPGMAGAVILAARAAYEAGSGLVYILSHRENLTVIQSSVPEAVFVPLYEDNKLNEKEIKRILGFSDALMIGSGMEESDENCKVLKFIAENYNKTAVIDAGGIRNLSRILEKEGSFNNSFSRIFLTPHLKEYGDFIHCSVSELKKDILLYSDKISDYINCTLILKDAFTVIKDKENTYINYRGAPSLSVGGSGDVLAGVMAALLAFEEREGNCNNDFETAVTAVVLHALSGERAYEKNAVSGNIEEIIKGIGIVSNDVLYKDVAKD